MIGANYMFHQHTMVPLIDGDLAATTFAKTLCYNTYFGSGKNQGADPSHAFGHVQIMGAMTPELLRAYVPARFRRWVPTWLLNRLSSNMVLFLVSTEDLPLLENRIEGTDPTALRLSYTPTLTRAHRHLVRKFATDLRRAARRIRPLDRRGFLGNITLVQPLPPVNWLRRLVFFRTLEFAANAHQCGTLKMGFNEADSVTDKDGRLWGMDNLYVTDASVFASSSHLNPSLTIYANALRVADGIAAETA